jgi:hypothetical protein
MAQAAVQSAFPIDRDVASFIGARTRKMLIDGKWVEAASGLTFTTYDPSTEEPLAEVAAGDKEDIDRAVKAARRAFESGPWRHMTPSERGRAIWKLADLIEARTEEFAQLETLDNGKPISVARVADVPLVVDHFRYYAGWATKVEGETIPVSTPGLHMLNYTLREAELSRAGEKGFEGCAPNAIGLERAGAHDSQVALREALREPREVEGTGTAALDFEERVRGEDKIDLVAAALPVGHSLRVGLPADCGAPEEFLRDGPFVPRGLALGWQSLEIIRGSRRVRRPDGGGKKVHERILGRLAERLCAF